MRRLFIDGEGRLQCGWKVLLFLVVYEIGADLLILPLIWLRHVVDLELVYMLSACLSALLTSLLFLRIEKRPFPSIGFRPDRRWAWQFLAGALAGTALMVLVALSIRAFDGFRWAWNPGLGLRALLSGAVLFIVVAIHEEVVYRGYPFQRMLENARPWLVNLAMAFYFTWIHRNNPGMEGTTGALAFLNIALAGVLLGLCYLKTGSLAAPIGLHLGWNWTQGCLLGFGVSGTTDAKGIWIPAFTGKPTWLTGGDFGLEASVFCALLCILAIAGLFAWKPTAMPPLQAEASMGLSEPGPGEG